MNCDAFLLINIFYFSVESVDEVVAGIFEIIAAYIRVNTVKAIKDFQVCLTANSRLILQNIRYQDDENEEINNANEALESMEQVADIFSDENYADDDSRQQITKKVLCFVWYMLSILYLYAHTETLSVFFSKFLKMKYNNVWKDQFFWIKLYILKL